MRNFISIIELMERAMRAPDFNQWFEGSVVVDEKGQPLRCYHGSFSAFDEFFVGSHFGDVEAANQRLDNVRGDQVRPVTI